MTGVEIALVSLAAVGAVTSVVSAFNQPKVPDTTGPAKQAQARVEFENSLTRSTDAELQAMLDDPNASVFNKNAAFREQEQKNVENERLTAFNAREEESAARQQAIDDSIESFQEATDIETFRAAVKAEADERSDVRIKDFDKEFESALTDIKQRQTARGLGSSSSRDKLELEAASLGALNRDEIRSNELLRSEGRLDNQIANQGAGVDRLVSGTGFNETVDQFNLNMREADRRLDQQLRLAQSAESRNAAFKAFEAEREQAMLKYQAAVNKNKSIGKAGAGIARLGLSGVNSLPDSGINTDPQFGASGFDRF